MKRMNFLIGLASIISGILILGHPGDTVYASGLFVREECVEEIRQDQIYVPLSEREEAEYASPYKAAKVYNSDWDKYSCSYIYNQLSEPQRLLWDGLDEMCLGYLTGTEDISETTKYVPTTLSRSESTTLAFLFIYSNPQYYFINTSFSYNTGSKRSIAIGVYKEFQSGTKRAEYTRRVKNSIEEIVRQASCASDDANRLRLLHDAIVDGVEYNDAVLLDGEIDDDEEEAQFTQSAYSALCLDYTVCAGYAKAFEMVCNALDIDCIAITSDDHAWNKVRIDDSWYNVDCTWDDANGRIYYEFYARNDRFFTDTGHKTEQIWQSLPPSASRDTGSTKDSPGTFPLPVGYTSAPLFTLTTAADGGTRVIISCSTANANIYYTLDGSLPSPAATKSYKYSGPFSANRAHTLRAIAVCDTYLDSEVVDYQLASASSLSEAALELEYDSVFYDGSAHTPSVTVTLDGQSLVMNEDYIVQYENNIALGEATVYILGSGSYTDTLTASFSIVLAVPELDSITNTSNAVTVKWDFVIGASGYYIYRKTKGGIYEEIADVDDGATISYKDTDITNGTTYIYTVKAYNGDHTSDWTKAGLKIVRLTRPTISSTAVSGRQLTVKWKANTKVTGYQISYTVGSTTKTIKVTGAATLSKVLSSLKKGKTYKIRIRGYKTVGDTTYYSAWSATKSVKI